MKRILIPTCVLAVAAFVVVSAHAQQPSIASNGILNGASYALPGLPNAGIAQGSIFVIFGQNLGPASLVQVSSFPLPTSQGLAGTSVKVTVGGTTVDAIMLYTSAGQVAAVMPSNTPLGSGTVTVTYNNQTSNSASVTVVRNSFGVFALNQAGSGPGVIQNYNSAADAPFNTVTEAARPGQVVILWGTGLGPVSGNEAGQALPGDMTNVSARVLVGGREATVQYRGRSGCCVGIDQVNFVVPQGVEGCYVPVAIQIGNVVSNYASMAISSAGRVCSDPYGYPSADLEAAKQRGTFRLGAVGLVRIIAHLGGVEFTTDTGGASFMRWDDFNRFLRFQGGQSGAITLPLGVCTVYSYRASGSQIDPANGTGMDAGSAINISGPRGNRQLTQQAPGIYGGILSDPLNPFTGAYLEPGSYSINNGSGGTVGPFQVSQTLPQTLQWLNESSITAVNRSQGVQVTWSAADPNGVVQIQGVATDVSNTVTGGFICLERASANSFTVPSAILLALPATGGSAEKGALFVGSSTIATRFTASGLDYGAMSTTVLIFKQVAYQ
ncbi:MAG: hypothetical protein A3H27_02380 [Acidobacteria bacterium RIFCSPLOWO2_02_FULL_59_13]|nr:MAG: hypothetical protein A3H27_02380 [Acidobacteria bacterium RIFCSPLOWO2_02_FULL_59_13]